MRRIVMALLRWGEGLPATPARLAALFAATVIVRNLLEAEATAGIFHSSAFVFHFPIAYVFPMVTLTWLLHVLSGYPAGRLLKVMVLTWTLTLLPPLVDLMVGTSTAIGYFPLQRGNAAHFLLNFFNPAVELTGTTAGIRIEAAIGCILAGVFVGTIARTARFLRGLATTVLFAPVFLVFFTWPHLVQILTSGLFFNAGEAQMYFQWRVSTEPVLFGGAHMTVFLVDMLPTVLFGLLLLRAVSRDLWEMARTTIAARPEAYLACLAGTAAALVAALSGSVLSFADLWAVIGALLAGCLVAASAGLRKGGGGVRAALLAAGLLTAAAAGWTTLVAAGLAAALLHLPGPARLSRILGYPALFLLAAAPVLDPVKTSMLLLLALPAALAGLPRRRRTAAALALPALAAALVLAPGEPTSPAEGRSRENRYFSHSGRTAHAHLGSMGMAAADDELMRFSESAHLLGMTHRSRWAYRVATARGDTCSELLRVGLNLEMRNLSPGELQERLDLLRSLSRRDEGDALITAVLANATARRDTTLLRSMMEELGPVPRLHTAYSRVLIAAGDTSGAWRYGRLAASHPSAGSSQLAWAVTTAAMAGADYDSLYGLAESRLGADMDLMTARLRAPLLAGRSPDRRDLLELCLQIRPESADVLELASLWYLRDGDYPRAMLMAERGIAATLRPSRRMFELACAAAVETGSWPRLEAAAEYGLRRFPGDTMLRVYLAAAMTGMGRTEEAAERLRAIPELPELSGRLDSLTAAATEG
ncbi:MAG: tetratricopeptide repeat protein [Candidatus Fermentibacterota bacterium]